MEWVDPYGWHVVDGDRLHAIYEKLCCFERMTWGEILAKGHKQNHLVELPELCKDARDRLGHIGQSDLDHLLSLRLSGAERVWAILNGGVATLLWWDPAHLVCPSFRKHT